MIAIDGLRTVFGDKVVLDGVDLTVAEGTTMALLGRSGSGKSVLLKQVVGLIRPTAGTVEVDGTVVDVDDHDALVLLRRRIGYVFQFAALFDSMSCADNIRMGLIRQELPDDEIEARVSNALTVVGLPEVAGDYPADLSGGMRKRVGIARAVALRPSYILWDEPTTGLDPVTTATISELIVRVGKELGVTSLVVTHDLGSAFKIADRIALLHDGRIRAEGTPEAIRTNDDPVVRQFIEGRPE